MANPEYSMGIGRLESGTPNEERPLNLDQQLEHIEHLLELNDDNENSIERTRTRERLQEKQDALLDDIENNSGQSF